MKSCLSVWQHFPSASKIYFKISFMQVYFPHIYAWEVFILSLFLKVIPALYRLLYWQTSLSVHTWKMLLSFGWLCFLWEFCHSYLCFSIFNEFLNFLSQTANNTFSLSLASRNLILILFLFNHPVMSNFCNPMDYSMPGLSVPHHLLKFAQVHVHCISDAILSSHPLMLSSPSALNFSQHQGLFQWVSCSH